MNPSDTDPLTSSQELHFLTRATQFQSHAMEILKEAKREHQQAGLPWVYREECCEKENWLIKEYADGKKLLVEILPGGKENILQEL